MKITPLEIRQHEFEKTFRGYNIEEVDNFLANLSQEWERILNESKMLRMQLEIAEKEASKLREIEMTLFKTLKTAEDTSTMITEQANQQAEKHIQESKQKSEEVLQDSQQKSEQVLLEAQNKAAEIVRQAENQAKYIKEEVLGEVKVLERDFKAMDHYKTDLLVQMKNLSNATLEHVQRFEAKFDKEGINDKFKEAAAMLSEGEVETAKNVEEAEVPQVEAIVEEMAIESNDNPSETIAEQIPEAPQQKIEEKPEPEEAPVEEPEEEPVEEEPETPIMDEPVEEEPVKVEEEPVKAEQSIQSEEPIVNVEEPIQAKQEPETVIQSSANHLVEPVDVPLEEAIIPEDKEEEKVPYVPYRVAEEKKSDELEVIEGIGPKIAMLLYDAGIFSYRDLATTPTYKIKDILENAGPSYAMHDPSTWVEQALLAAEGRFAELEEMKDRLVGGKVVEDVEEKAFDNNVGFFDTFDTIETPQNTYVEPVGNEVKPSEAEITLNEIEARAKEADQKPEEAPKKLEETKPLVPENNIESITEEMLEKVNKVKAAIRKAMVEKADSPTKDNSPLPTVNDVIGKNNENNSGGSFFDNL